MEDKELKPGHSDASLSKRKIKLEQQMRQLEVEAYCALISAFRVQGDLTWKKAQILQDLRQLLRISDERHKMELKRVSEDDHLCEIAKLNSSLQFAESLDTGDDASGKQAARGTSRKKGRAVWGDGKEKPLPYLDAVAAPISAQPPNLSKIPSVVKNSKSKQTKAGTAVGKSVTPKATPVKAAPTQISAANRKRKTPASATKKAGGAAKKRGSSKPKDIKTEIVQESVVDPMAEEVDVALAEEGHIKEIEDALKAKQEQLKAELAALRAEISENEDEQPDQPDQEGPEGSLFEETVGAENVDVEE